MLKLINLHLVYVFNKRNVILLSFILLLFVLLCIMKVNAFESVNNQVLYAKQYKLEYDYITVLVSEIIVYLLSTYLFSKTRKNSYFVLSKTSKFMFYFTRVISYVFIVAFICALLYIIYFIIGFLFSKWFCFDYKIFFKYILCFEKSIVLGVLSLVITSIFKSSFAFILVFISFFIINNVFEKNIYTQLISIIMPIFCDDISYSFRLIIQIICYFLIGFVMFLKNENY